jgi:hypothetical protein
MPHLPIFLLCLAPHARAGAGRASDNNAHDTPCGGGGVLGGGGGGACGVRRKVGVSSTVRCCPQASVPRPSLAAAFSEPESLESLTSRQLATWPAAGLLAIDPFPSSRERPRADIPQN